MLRQVTVIKFKPDTTDENIAAVSSGFDAIANIVPGLHRFEHGRDVGLMDGAWDYALVIDFESADAWAAYRDHPDHVNFAKTFAPLAENAVRVQYQLS